MRRSGSVLKRLTQALPSQAQTTPFPLGSSSAALQGLAEQGYGASARPSSLPALSCTSNSLMSAGLKATQQALAFAREDSRLALGSRSQGDDIPVSQTSSSSCSLSTSAACASSSTDDERRRSNGAASSSKPQSAMDIVKRRLGLQFEGMTFHLPNSPFKKSRLGPPMEKMVLYRGRGMLPFRFLVRAKVFQLLGFMTCAAMLTTVAGTNQALSPTDIAVGTSVIVGCIVTSYCLWFYSGRYVGELSLLLPSKRVARFSVLDFWGNREDNDIPIECIDPPFYNRNVAEVKSIVSQRLMPIAVKGDRQYYISPRHGYVLQKDVLNKICYGKWLKELDGKILEATITSTSTRTSSPPLPNAPPLEKHAQQTHDHSAISLNNEDVLNRPS